MNIGSIQSSTLNTAFSAAKASALAYHDPRDTNKDGVVSPAEDLAYSHKHPEVAALKRLRTVQDASVSLETSNPSLNHYTQSGNLNDASGKVASNLFDGYV